MPTLIQRAEWRALRHGNTTLLKHDGSGSDAGFAYTLRCDLNVNRPPRKLDAPDLSTLLQENVHSAGDNWLYFGQKVAAAELTGLVNGRTFDLSNGEPIIRLEANDPAFDSIALSNLNALIDHAWKPEISIYDFLGNDLRTLTAPLTGDRHGHPIAIEGNLALVGVPGRKYEPTMPGRAILFDIETGQELMNFSAENVGVVSLHGGDGFGRAVAIHGNFALIGAPYDSELNDRSGAAYLFDIRTGELLEKILPTSREYPYGFGSAVALTNGQALIEDLTFDGREQVPMTLVYSLIPEPTTITLALLALAFGWHAVFRHGGR